MLTDAELTACRLLRIRLPVPPDEEFDSWELETGIKIEYEHTQNMDLAKIIAKHHLIEFPNYYTYLVGMEEQLREFWERHG